MIGRKQEIQTQALQLIDSLLLLLAFWLARILRETLVVYDIIEKGQLGPGLQDILWILFIVVPFTPIALENYGFYDHPLHKSRGDSFRQMFQALLVMAVVVAVGVVFFKLEPSSRLVLGMAVPLAGGLLLLREAVTRRQIRKRVDAGEKLESVVFAGSPEDIRQLREKLPVGILSEWRVVEMFDLEQRDPSELPRVLHEKNVGRVVFAAAHAEFGKVQAAVRACEIEGVEAWVYANFLQTAIARPTFDSLGGQPMLVFRTTPDLSWSLLIKGVIDRVGALLILLLSLPLWIVAAVGIKASSPGGPVFYRQQRAGRYGTPFTMLKFRTMVPDADKKLEEIKKGNGNQMSGPVFKLAHDPRIFPFGRFLRKYSIDELPQLWNVLLGDMSLVGPRPMALYEIPRIEKSSHRRKLSVKPGLTCLWQVSGRNEISDFDHWVKLDLQYIDNWSLWLDMKILLRTVPAVVSARGAK